MRPIKEGDTVTVVMTQAGKCFDFQAGTEIYQVTVLHVPKASGALWWFRLDEVEFAVNPCSPDFVGLILEAVEDDCSHLCSGCETILGVGRKCPATGDEVGAPLPPTRWMDWPGRWSRSVRIIGGDGD